MKGRSPKDPGLDALQGHPGRRPAKPAPEVFFSEAEGEPWAPPGWLPEGAKAVWRREIADIRRQTKVQEVGRQVVAMYCDALHRLESYTADVEREGAVYKTASGYLRKTPYVELRDRAVRDVADLADRLNLTPKSWIGSMGTFAGRQLDLFMQGGRPPEADRAGPKPDDGDSFFAAPPTLQ